MCERLVHLTQRWWGRVGEVLRLLVHPSSLGHRILSLGFFREGI